MHTCPICRSTATAQHPNTPYWICPTCDLWFQAPLPPKLLHGAHEAPPDAMGEQERAINDALAAHLFRHVMGGEPGLTLDVGAAYPWLARCLAQRGCTAAAMEPAPEAAAWARELGVVPLTVDFEQWEPTRREPARLVTFVHSFEHCYDPIAALERARGAVRSDGAVFIRMPDHRVPGIERDLTAGHFTIHPYVHTLTSIMEALAQLGDAFVIAEERALLPGQRDLVLRPITRAPAISLGMIVRNEERDLPRCLASVLPVVDRAVVIDTGSTDRTMQIADEHGCMVVRQFLGASEQDEAGAWRLTDFSAARNEFVREVEALDAREASRGDQWLLWMDADDELLNPQAVRRAVYLTAYDCFAIWIQDGGLRWIQHRMWKTGRGARFKGACHEYPVLDGLKCFTLDECTIRHDSAPGVGETSNARNLRMLLAEWERDPSPRCAFYLANTHRDGGRYAEAVPWYERRIAMGEAGHRDEWLFAQLYMARAQRAAGDTAGAEATLVAAIAAAPGWAEFHMEHAFCAYHTGRYAEAIERALRTPITIPLTHLWREPTMYTDQPPRIISWCHEHLGDMVAALQWAEHAAELISGPDPDWDARIARLRSIVQPEPAGPAVALRAIEGIALCRPGAIGDILMTLNLLPALREANPGLPIHYFCDAGLGAHDALGGLMRAAGVDVVMDCAQWPSWRGKFARAIDLVGYPLHEGYPERPMRLHLLQYFAAEMGLDASGGLPALTVPRPRRPAGVAAGDYATIQTRAGWSKYKAWLPERWEALRAALRDIPLVDIDAATGRPLAESIALVANARMHIGIDSFANHLTHFYWTDRRGGRRVPGVIVWGSTQAAASGYPGNTNLSTALACQPCFREDPAISRMDRGPCVNPPRASYADDTPPACAAAISVEHVALAVRQMWRRVAAPATAVTA